MKHLTFAVVLSLAMMSVTHASDTGLTAKQFDSIILLVLKIKGCPHYSFNLGANRPYEESCVNPLVESASAIFTAFIPDSSRLVREVESIKQCAYYFLHHKALYGTGNAYEEACVDRLVDNVVADLRDMKAKSAK
jgi:hypothetical protein